MPSWPIDLPQRQQHAEVERLDPIIRTPMEIGPAKARRRPGPVLERVRIPMRLNAFQYERFWEWWRTDLLGGTLTFTWEHPFTDDVVNYRFLATPAFSLVLGGHTRDLRATLHLEIMP